MMVKAHGMLGLLTCSYPWLWLFSIVSRLFKMQKNKRREDDV